MIVPWKVVVVSRVAEVPTCQVTLADLAPLARITRRPAVAVNVDPTESDLRPLAEDEAMAILLGTAQPGADRSEARAAAALARAGFGNPETVASWLLLLMLLAFLIESALTAQRIGRS